MGILLSGIGAFLLIRVCFSLRAYSPNDQHHLVSIDTKGLNIAHLQGLKLRLKACSNGHIVLQEGKLPALLTLGTWIFLIGSYGNTRGEIADSLISADTRYARHTEVLLDCSEFRSFWISWKDGLLQLGKGDKIGLNAISVHQTSPVKQFNFAFLFTGWGSTGCWDIDTGSSVLVTKWIKLPGNKKLQGLEAKSYHIISQLECGVKCMTPTEDLPCGCVEYSYNMVTKQCLIVDESETSTIVTATDWRTWQLM